MKKKIICVILTLTLAVSILPGTAGPDAAQAAVYDTVFNHAVITPGGGFSYTDFIPMQDGSLYYIKWQGEENPDSLLQPTEVPVETDIFGRNVVDIVSYNDGYYVLRSNGELWEYEYATPLSVSGFVTGFTSRLAKTNILSIHDSYNYGVRAALSENGEVLVWGKNNGHGDRHDEFCGSLYKRGRRSDGRALFHRHPCHSFHGNAHRHKPQP